MSDLRTLVLGLAVFALSACAAGTSLEDASSDPDGGVPFDAVSTPCIDEDGDGYGIGCRVADCADDDPTIHPGAPESCNGVDDDCSGAADEGCACENGASRDCGSAIGACAQGAQRCAGGTWGACEGQIEPSVETCDGVLDEDCDATVDEGCECTDGASRSCGSAIGACVEGTETCLGGAWTECAGARGPTDETCDGTADEDCDGTVDEGCACVDGSVRGCGSDVGACAAGSQRCTAGAWGACSGGVTPASEVCEGSADEDCDGAVDEGCLCTNGTTRSCGSDVGACVAGTETCVGGAWARCTGAVGPTPEVCDGALDEDCDGTRDEGCACTNGATRACGSDVGACVAGTETCSMGAWGSCAGAVGPSTERCDGALDDDCDGTADEGCLCTNGATRPCGSDVGACAAGSQTCVSGSWASCAGAVGPSAETCDGAVDESCDGTVDEGCDCVDGRSESCGSDVGACVAGTRTCAAGRWSACAGETGPATEVCYDGVDQDCDGRVDDGCGADHDVRPTFGASVFISDLAVDSADRPAVLYQESTGSAWISHLSRWDGAAWIHEPAPSYRRPEYGALSFDFAERPVILACDTTGATLHTRTGPGSWSAVVVAAAGCSQPELHRDPSGVVHAMISFSAGRGYFTYDADGWRSGGTAFGFSSTMVGAARGPSFTLDSTGLPHGALGTRTGPDWSLDYAVRVADLTAGGWVGSVVTAAGFGAFYDHSEAHWVVSPTPSTLVLSSSRLCNYLVRDGAGRWSFGPDGTLRDTSVGMPAGAAGLESAGCRVEPAPGGTFWVLQPRKLASIPVGTGDFVVRRADASGVVTTVGTHPGRVPSSSFDNYDTVSDSTGALHAVYTEVSGASSLLALRYVRYRP